VATDIAARGIDVDGISHVVNYDSDALGGLFHRIGRTGRAHAIGDAISFVTPEDQGPLRSLDVSSAAGSYGKRRKVSIIIRLRRHATSSAGEHESRSERTSRDYQEILRVEAASPHGRSGGVFGMLHRTTVRRADLSKASLIRVRTR